MTHLILNTEELYFLCGSLKMIFFLAEDVEKMFSLPLVSSVWLGWELQARLKELIS